MKVGSSLQLARSLVELFYPLVELTVFDKNGLIKEISNSFSSLKEDQECDFQNVDQLKPFLELLAVGKSVKCVLSPFLEENVEVGFLRIRYDLTCFKSLQEQLNLLVQMDVAPEPFDLWKDAIDKTILGYLTDNKTSLQAVSAKQKREIISNLQDKGLLEFKESSSYVALRLQVSRATIYNYLKTTADFKKIQVHRVDAFTCKQFGGNPAGVVLDADQLDELTMRKIARELNFSETVFVLSSKKGTFQLRYFTPTGHEINFCGHSTVGALYMIAKEGRFGVGHEGSYVFDVETPCGILKMEAFLDSAKEIRVAYEAPLINLTSSIISHEDVCKAAGFELDLVKKSLPVMYEETNRDLFIFVKSLEDLKKVECDPKSFVQFSKHHNIVTLCVVSSDTFDEKYQFHMRCFAPLVGIPEDPVTGSVLGGLTAYVNEFDLLSKNSNGFQVEQGHFMDRPGTLRVEFTKKEGSYFAKVFAQAVHCFSTEMNLT